MKKLLLLLFVTIATTVFAQNKINFIKGNFDFLKDQTEVNVQLKFDDALFQVENLTEAQYLERRKTETIAKKDEAAWVKWNDEWQKHKESVYLEKFLKGLSKSKKITFNKDLKSKYTLIVYTKWIYAGWHGGLMIQPGKLTSDLIFVETDNPSNVIMEIKGDKVEGMGNKNDYVMEYGRISAAYERTGKLLSKEINKVIK